MDIGEITVTGSGEEWIEWLPGVEVCLAYVSPKIDRHMAKHIMKPQFRGHQRMEDEVDTAAMRDYFCKHIIKGIRGLTRDGQAFSPNEEELKQIWDGNHEFCMFCIEQSRRMQNFIQEKKA